MAAPLPLPTAIRTKLARIRRREIIIAAVRTAAITAAVLLASITVAMAIDWQYTLFDVPWRIALTAAALLTACMTAVYLGVPALRDAFRVTGAARRADAELPQLEERWMTVVSLSASAQQPASAIARAMQQQVTSEATALARLVEPARVVRPGVLRRAGTGLAASVLAFALFLALDWRQTSVLWQRFWQPTADITATRLRSTTGDVIVPRGEAVELIAEWTGVPRSSATLFIARDDGGVETLPLTPATDRDAFALRMKVDGSFRYRVRAGDGQTTWQRVTAIDYPALAEVQFTITSPEYARRPAVEKTLLPARIKVLQGSRLQLRMRPNAPLERLELQLTRNDLEAEPRTLLLKPDKNGWYQFESVLLKDLTLSPQLWNSYGLTEDDRRACRIEVLPDQPPVARVLTPTVEATVANDDVIDIRFEAHDDHGVAGAALVVFDESRSEEGAPRVLAVLPIPLGEQLLEKRVQLNTQLDLKKLGLESGMQISYAVRVTDNRAVTAEPMPDETGEQNERKDGAVADREPRETEADSDPTAKPNSTASVASSDKPRATALAKTTQETGDVTPATTATPQKTDPGTATVARTRPAAERPTNAIRPENVMADQLPLEDSLTAQAASNANSGMPTERASDDPTQSPQQMALAPQQSEAGQNAETERRRLRIAERLAAVATVMERRAERSDVRDRIAQINERLGEVESGLERLVSRDIPDADRSEQARRLDEQLGAIETSISKLRDDTRDQQFAFVGLQMADIGRTHVTPARERVFAAIRDVNDANVPKALEHVVRARELLTALLTRYDRAARDQQLAEALQEVAKIYEVYVERSQQLLREARQNRNPLERKMAVLELDQEYLDRYAEVLRLRREMMTEFGRLMADDPRLLARYLESVKRRRSSLRDQLSQLAERQIELETEVAGWSQSDGNQREDLWMLLVELRLQSATPLAKDAAELAERVEKQLPLELESDQGTSRMIVQTAQQIASVARSIALEARRQLQQPGTNIDWHSSADHLADLFVQLDAALEQLNFEHEQDQEVSGYVTARLLENRTVADQAQAWRLRVRHVGRKHYAGLAELDQQQLLLATELLRTDMLGTEIELEQMFQQQAETSLPGEIAELVRELQRLMEDITFQQAAATFALTQEHIHAALEQQARATANFAKAEELFDRIRRQVAAALDEFDVPNPNIADLRDPTLDEFLAQLEREPNIEAQLGLPERPRNLRVIAESMSWQQNGGDLLGDAEEAARRRVQQMIRQKPKDAPAKPESDLTAEERKARDEAQELEVALTEAFAQLQKQKDAPETPPELRRRLEQKMKDLERFQQQIGQAQRSDEEWNRVAETVQAKELLKALARGDGIPDQQWNKLVSSLDDGLWQVGGRTPPAAYRRAIEQYQARLRRVLDGSEIEP